MIVNVSFQAYLFFITILVGMSMGFLYDILRILRRAFKHPNFLIHLEDLLYWVAVSFFFFGILFYESYGEIRGFSILGALFGAGLYFLVLSPWILYLSLAVIQFVKNIISWIVKTLMKPILWILGLLSYPYRWIRGILQFIKEKCMLFGRKSCRYSYRKLKKAKKNLFIIIKKV